MPNASDPRLARRAMTFSGSSCVRGTSSMMAMPTSGVNTPAVSSQLWSVKFIPLLHGDDENEGADGSRPEEDRSVLLDLARLHRAQRLAAFLRRRGAAVHDTVDHSLVE